MRRVLAISTLALLSSLACENPGAPPPRVAPPEYSMLATASFDGTPLPPPAPAPAVRADGRLPRTAIPLRYALDLTVDPNEERFSGTAKILVELPAPTTHVILHGKDLHVSKATVRLANVEIAGVAAARVAHGGIKPEELVLTFPRALPKGRAIVEIAYDAPFAKDLLGLHRIKERGEAYAFTKFEPSEARRAFPCFDDPTFKTPYDLSLTVPKGMLAASNAPQVAEEGRGASTVFRFATTRPLPSYLVAFAVGDLDIRAGATSPVPIRLVTTKGKTALGALALGATKALVDGLGDYFGVRYPYEKLDMVAVPDFASGAMENAAFITFREPLLLLDPQTASASSRRSQVAVIAHELSHMWFGDLVTMEWWNDLWLNEGFADWMEKKVVDRYKPSLGRELEAKLDIDGVMDLDSLRSARAVRQPVTSVAEAMEAFDGITYDKGAAVLRMLEGYVGEEAFQRGVRDYVRAHAWGNAKSEDLLKALELASNKELRPIASSFLDQPGVPVVTASVSCAPGAPPKVELRQAAWRPLGAPDVQTAKRSWAVPVCMHVEGQRAKSCAIVGDAPVVKELDGKRCPAFLYPNADQTGYFRFSLAEKDIAALASGRAKLDAAERVGLLANLWSMVRAGDVSPKVLLATLASFDGETDRFVVEKLVDVLFSLDETLVDDAVRSQFRAYVAARLLPQKRRLGWEPRKGTEDDEAAARRMVLRGLGVLAEDEATLREADAYAKAWLKDPHSVSGDIAQTAVELGSRRAGEARLAALRDVARGAKTPQDRVIALRSMAAFGDAAVLAKALDVVLTDEVKMSDVRYFPWTVLAYRASRRPYFEWMKSHWDGLLGKFPMRLRYGLSRVAQTMCTEGARKEAEEFFVPRLSEVEGAKRGLSTALEAASLCVALHDRGAQAVTDYFKKGR